MATMLYRNGVKVTTKLYGQPKDPPKTNSLDSMHSIRSIHIMTLGYY